MKVPLYQSLYPQKKNTFIVQFSAKKKLKNLPRGNIPNMLEEIFSLRRSLGGGNFRVNIHPCFETDMFRCDECGRGHMRYDKMMECLAEHQG